MKKPTKRTAKLFVGISVGAHVLSDDWLSASVKAGKFVDESVYMLQDAEFEKRWKFSLRETLNKARVSEHGVCGGCAFVSVYCIFLCLHVYMCLYLFVSVFVCTCLHVSVSICVHIGMCVRGQRQNALFRCRI